MLLQHTRDLGYTALLLGVLVFVHEFGHFLIAKLFRVKVLRFSIGFGPRIAGFTWGETEYRLAWVPLGGYVKMAGELPFEELPPEDARRGFLAQAPWKRAFIVMAGPVFNLAFPIAVFFLIFYLGLHQEISTRVGSVSPGLPAAMAGVQPGDRILAIDGEPTGTFPELRAALQTKVNRKITLTLDRAGQKIEVQVTPAKLTDQTSIETVQQGMIGMSPLTRSAVVGVPAGSPAAEAGLQTFDRVLSVNGQPVQDEVSLTALLRPMQGPLDLEVAHVHPVSIPGLGLQSSELAHVHLDRQPGEGLAALGVEPIDPYVGAVLPGSAAEKAGLKRGDRLVSVDGRPLPSFILLLIVLDDAQARPIQLAWRTGSELKTAQIQQTRLELEDPYGQKVKQLSLGLVPGADLLPDSVRQVEMVRVHPGAIDSMRMSLRVVPEVIRKTALSLAAISTGKVPIESLGGPGMLYQIAKKSAEEGIDSYLQAMAFISVNLGLINLLPIPILDGFHLLAAAWEGVRRRPIPMRAREVANMIGLAMLFILMVIVLRNDITR
jgi:regulator of sigma E protease